MSEQDFVSLATAIYINMINQGCDREVAERLSIQEARSFIGKAQYNYGLIHIR